MGIVNRTMDATEQKEALVISHSNVVNQHDLVAKVIERPCVISDMKVAMLGVSGSPNVLLKALRFVAGTGGSSFLIGSTFAVTTFATSGYLSYSLPASGSTLLNLQKGDVLVVVQGGGTGAASTATTIEIVLQNTQDIKSWY